jgi:hypothetical protein
VLNPGFSSADKKVLKFYSNFILRKRTFNNLLKNYDFKGKKKTYKKRKKRVECHTEKRKQILGF